MFSIRIFWSGRACGGEGLTPHHPKPAASYEYIVDFVVYTVCRVFKSRQEEWENMCVNTHVFKK